VFLFDLCPGVVSTIQEHHGDSIRYAAAALGLSKLEPKAFVDSLPVAAKQGAAPAATLASRLVSALGNGMSEVGASTLGSYISLFAASAAAADGISSAYDVAVAANEVVAGLVFFTGGSKSVKLAVSFQLFDVDQDGKLTRSEVERFLRAFLVAMFLPIPDALTSDASASALGHDMEAFGATMARAATTASDRVFADATRAAEHTVSYEEFGEWYNRGGFELLPWLELLGLGKWPSAMVDRR
jgi:hypothetical protein